MRSPTARSTSGEVRQGQLGYAGLRDGTHSGRDFSPTARDVRFGNGVGLLGWPTIKCGLLRLKTGGRAACSRQEGGIGAVH